MWVNHTASCYCLLPLLRRVDSVVGLTALFRAVLVGGQCVIFLGKDI
jgi:hypothetical protein